jgi:Winged helix DNA-binding domain
MTPGKLPHYRLHSQRLTARRLETPANVVRWLGAVQAQEYPGSLWAIGLRCRGATERLVEQAISERAIVRTWPMRGTLHFVAAEDLRWMLQLLTPRVKAARVARYERDYGLDPRTIARSGDIVGRALEGGRRLTRAAINRILDGAGIPAAGGRGLHIAWRLAHDGLICFGPREGKQHTFVLLDEWVPPAKPLDREEALAGLAARYFASHGPATVRDFAWWSGLRLGDAAAGLAAASSGLASIQVAGTTYWASSSGPAGRSSPRAFLLPAFDEYTVAYRDRDALASPAHRRYVQGVDILQPVIVVDGRVVGTWTRRLANGSVAIELSPFIRLAPAAARAVAVAARRYAAFLERLDDGS